MRTGNFKYVHYSIRFWKSYIVEFPLDADFGVTM